MKRGGIINAQLAGAVARLGHTDELVVCDAGLPIPDGPEVVDLAFRLGDIAFETVLRGLSEELVVEGALAAGEVRETSPAVRDLLSSLFPDISFITHSELKRRVLGARLVVRTGEATPYANVILSCGVPF